MLLVTPRPTPAVLSPRELEVVELLCVGLAPKEIAGRLSLSIWTVKGYLASARLRTGTRSNAHLAHFFGANRRARRERG